MGRIILPALVAFLLALGGTSARAVVQAKHAKPATVAHADSGAAHDSAHASAPHDSAAPPHDSLAVAHGAAGALPDSAAHAAAGANIHAAPARRANATGVPAVPSPIVADTGLAQRAEKAVAAQATPAPQERRLAKIFGNMSPKDAARVLLQMGDDDVQTILSYLGDRQAAAILVNFPPQRAALIGRAAMRPTGAPLASRGTAAPEGR